MSRLGSVSLDQVVGVGTPLSRSFHGSIASLVATVRPSGLAPLICSDTVPHWFGIVKNFLAITQVFCVLSMGSPVFVARAGDFTTDLADDKHSSSLLHEGALLGKVCADVEHGRALVFELGSAADIWGLRISSLPAVGKPQFCVVHQKHDRNSRISVSWVDVKDAFQQVPVDPAGAPIFWYVAGGHVVVDCVYSSSGETASGFESWLRRRSNIPTLVPRFKTQSCPFKGRLPSRTS